MSNWELLRRITPFGCREIINASNPLSFQLTTTIYIPNALPQRVEPEYVLRYQPLKSYTYLCLDHFLRAYLVETSPNSAFMEFPSYDFAYTLNNDRINSTG